MSREIKFRVWFKPTAKYRADFEDRYHHKLEDLYSTIYTKDDFLDDTWCDIDDYDSIVFEQYTGLKDKNGKEIYEGDIVAVRDDDIPFALVNAMTTNKWMVRFGMHRAAFTLVKSTKKRNFIRTFQHIKPEDIEVIGNIHENPELLRGEE